MSKLFLFLPLFLFAEFINIPYTFFSEKDEIKVFNIYYRNFDYFFRLRWTLYKNSFIVVLYNFNGFSRQVMLSKEYPLNSFRVNIALFEPFSPYLYVKFAGFNDKIATFKIFLFNSKSVKIEEIK